MGAPAGNAAKEKKHFSARFGISVADLTGIPEESNGIEHRFVGGGLFTGNRVKPSDFLSPYERSVQVMQEDRVRHPFALLRPGFEHLTLFRSWFSGWFPNVEREATTSNNGEERACIQCGACIDICPVELMPNIIFKHALEGDIEKMEQSFIHDCVDCGLCTFICPSKIELAQHLEDGKKLIDYLTSASESEANQTAIMAEFLMDKPDDRVEYDIWFTSSNDIALDAEPSDTTKNKKDKRAKKDKKKREKGNC